VLILTDDQNPDEMRWMPRTRRLVGDQGLRFTRATSPHPLCCPARAEILTGKYGQNSGVRHNSGKYGGWKGYLRGGNLESNLAVWLRQQGYLTALVGKFLNGYDPEKEDQPPGWDHWNPTGRGTYSYYGTTFHADGHPHRYQRRYVADVARDYASDYLRQYARRDRPFFLWVADVAPHEASGPIVRRRYGTQWGPPLPARRHVGLFHRAPLPSARKPSFDERDVDDKPHPLRRAKRQDPADLTFAFRQRIRSLQAVDEGNARILRQLDRLGELDDTYVFYLSDNGFLLGEHRLRGKNYGFREDLSVPFEVRGPGVGPDRTSRTPVSLLDLAPTFLDIAGVTGAERRGLGLDARSILPELHGRRPGPGDTQLIQGGTASPAHMKDEHSLSPGWWWRGVTTRRYVYQAWFDGDEALYDLRRDPFELRNLVDLARPGNPLRDPSYAPVLEELRRRYAQLQDCAGADACERRFGPVTRK
jgi:arylsulfatase A-like enzyme